MNVLIYESSSRGGCYEYSKYIYNSYSLDKRVKSCELLVPKSSELTGVSNILLSDWIIENKTLSRVSFALRSLINPLILISKLLFRKRSIVILNDFEQLTAFVWVPFILLLKYRHTFVLFVHDSNRDDYFSLKWLSVATMKMITYFPDLILYHDYLPKKSYYKYGPERYISVPHGLYQVEDPDKTILQELQKDTRHKFLILGNMRNEKNYELAIRAMKTLDNSCLIIAGSPSNKSFNVENIKKIASDLGVEARVKWYVRYLLDSEFSAMLHACDTLMLYYKKGFNAQSGILNQAMQIGKTVIVSDLNTGLSNTVSRFKLGKVVKPDDLDALTNSMMDCLNNNEYIDTSDFLNYSSWANQVNVVISKLMEK